MELKIGQLAIIGKITARRSTMFDGKTFNHVEIMTDHQYPSVFDFWTQDPTVAAANVPDLAVGCRVLAVGWVNGRKLTSYTDKKTGEVKTLKFPQYKTSIRLDGLTAAPTEEQPSDKSQVNDDSDIPF